MAKAVASRALVLSLLLLVQNVFCQFTNTNCVKSTGNQQSQKSTCPLSLLAQNAGINFNLPQQASVPQINYQLPSSIQQTTGQQTVELPPMNILQQNTQQATNPMPTSQAQLQNQNLVSSLFSALQNIKPTQSQGVNFGKITLQPCNTCASGQNLERAISQNQGPIFAITSPNENKRQVVQSIPVQSSYINSAQPTITFQAVSNGNAPNIQAPQQTQLFTLNTAGVTSNNSPPTQVLYVSSNSQSEPKQVQNFATIPSSSKPSQNQPLVLSFSPIHTPLASSSNPQQSQPTYTLKLAAPAQNPVIASQPTGYNIPLDNQLLPYMAQLQSQGNSNSNALASILPALLNSKSEKPTSNLKSLLPLLLNLFGDNSGYGCSNCGCPHNCPPGPSMSNSYSNQRNYGQPSTDIVLEKSSVIKEDDASDKRDRKVVKNNVINTDNEEVSSEEDDGEEVDVDEEEIDDES